jgi:protein O-mannosyl-transferase
MPGRSVAFVLVIALAVAATFGRSIDHAFVYWDDHETIAHNDDFVRPTLAGVLRYWWTPRQELYIPVTYTFWGVLAFVSERDDGTLDPRVYRAANLALHATSAGLVFLILRRLVTSDLAALAGALLFAVHPVQVESVAWTSGAKDLLSGALSLAAILLYLRASDAEGRAAPGPSPGTPGEGGGEGDGERRE